MHDGHPALLHNGQVFPQLEIPAVGDGTISLPGNSPIPSLSSRSIAGRRARIATPSCLRSPGERQTRRVGDKVVAVSVDDEATSAALVEQHHLYLPVRHSADADADTVSAVTGASTNDDPHHCRRTGFVLAPDGSVLTTVIHKRRHPAGRLVADDVAGFVRYKKSQA